MVTQGDLLDIQVGTKHQFVGESEDLEVQDLVFKEKVRFWNKITRIRQDGTEVAVLLPYNTLIEPFYSADDVDLTIDNSAVFDEENERFRLFSDANGNYKILQSKVISLRENHRVSNVFVDVNATYVDGTDALDGIGIEIFNGNEWIPTTNGVKLNFRGVIGDDLDADLDCIPGGKFNNFVEGRVFDYDLDLDVSGWLFQNQIKYRIVRESSQEIHVNKVVLRITWEF